PTTVAATTIYVPPSVFLLAIFQNSCTSSLSSPVTLLYISNANSFGYNYYQYNYQAINYQSTITLAFRQDPSYWCLDDIAVSYGGVNLVTNGGFESGTLSGYFVFCNPNSASASGQVYAYCAHSGTYSYYDGSVQYSDYISQTFGTVSGRTYQVSFWLSNLGGPTNSATVIISA
ncbi:unnamed protein product, partial [Didymodactylos carnosus]